MGSAATRQERAPEHGDAGTAVVGTLVGFAIFLVLLLFAVQVVVRLYAESALTSAATRAAETVASSPRIVVDPGPAEAAAEGEMRDQLGSFGARHTTFSWRQADADQVVLEVASQSPEFLPGLPGWSRIERTVVVRTERFR